MPFDGPQIRLTSDQRADLQDIARSPALPAGFVQRARMVLALAAGSSYRAIADKLDTSRPTVSEVEASLSGARDRRIGHPPSGETGLEAHGPVARAHPQGHRPQAARRVDALVLPQTGP